MDQLRKHHFQQFLHCCMLIRCCGDVFVCVRYPVIALVYLLISCSLPNNGSTRYIAPSLRLFDSLQVYRHFFFSEGCAWSHLPPCDSVFTTITPKAPTTPSLLPLVPSGSSIGASQSRFITIILLYQ
jgi:hypothetical protein